MAGFISKYLNIDNFEANRKYYKQTFLLFSSRIFDLGIGFVTNMFIAKHLQQEQFGVYSFVFNFLLLISLFFDFGFFTSVSRILALNVDEVLKTQRISFYIKRLFSLMFFLSLIIFVTSFFVDSIFKVNVGHTLRMLSLLSGATLIATFLSNVTAGTNEVRKIFFYSISWRSIYTVVLLVLYFNLCFTVNNILISLFSCQIIFFLTIHYNQIFVKSKAEFRSELKKHTKEYGFDIYISRIVDTASYKTDSMLITYFHSTSNLSPYSIAQSFGSPVGILGNTVATIFFKNFATESKISNKIIFKNFIACFCFAIICYLLGFMCFKYYLKYNYSAYPQLLLFMISVSLFEATFAPFNMWFIAKGLYNEMRIKTYTTAVFNILLNLILIYYFAEMGAAVASLLSVALSMIIYVYLYNKVANNGKINSGKNI